MQLNDLQMYIMKNTQINGRLKHAISVKPEKNLPPEVYAAILACPGDSFRHKYYYAKNGGFLRCIQCDKELKWTAKKYCSIECKKKTEQVKRNSVEFIDDFHIKEDELIVYIEKLCKRNGKLIAYYLTTPSKWDVRYWSALQKIPGETNRDKYFYLKNGGYLKCGFCGNDMKKWGRTLGKSTKFCSVDCHNLHQGINKYLNCVICEKVFYPSNGYVATCSNECSFTLRSRAMKNNTNNPDFIKSRLTSRLEKMPQIFKDTTKIEWWQEHYIGKEISIAFLAEQFEISRDALMLRAKKLGVEIVQPSRSAIEIKFASEIAKFANDIVTSDRSIISPKELDIFIPSKNIAIEVNGIYWHSEEIVHKDYHLKKYEDCRKKGIRLFQFWETELNEKFDLCVSMIKHACGITSEKIGARKCEITKPPKKLVKQFIEENHLSGIWRLGNDYQALIYQGEIVAVAVFGKPRFSKNNENQVELIRFCVKKNLNVIGALARLIKASGHTRVISFSDNRYSEGNVYKSLGFVEKRTKIEPTLWWTDLKKIYHRMQSWKFDKIDGMTKKELMKLRGFYTLHDAGQRTWFLEMDK